MTQTEFIRTVAPMAVKLGRKYDVPPSILIAQAFLESRYGNSLLTTQANNLAGMKATGKSIPGIWDGEKTQRDTTENINGTNVIMPQYFRAYKSWEQSMEDIAHRYSQRFKLTLTKVGGNVDTFLAEPGMSEAMKTGYATDPFYKGKLEKIISEYNLKQFDNVALVGGQKKKHGYKETQYHSWDYLQQAA